MRRLLTPLVVAAAFVAVATSIAAITTADANPYGNAWSGDYATEELGDPWDFSNQEDWDVQARHDSPVASAAVRGGTLIFNVSRPAGGVLIGSAHYGDASMQWGRSSTIKPLDGSLYTTLTFRLYVPPGTSAPAGGVTWFSCGVTVAECAHNEPFFPQPGWNTYSMTPNWAGQRVYSMLIIPTAHTGSGFELDWVRATRPGGQTEQPPPGAEPLPVVLNPDRGGGADYAATVNGNLWDMSDPSDVASYENLDNVGYFLDTLFACNTNNDPAIVLPLGVPFDGSRFHRLGMIIHYDGGFGLADAPGGGMVARVMWTVAGSRAPQVSQDIVVYPGWNNIDLDMLTFPFHAVNEPDLGPGAGWIGQTITSLRIDFHEDPGRRCIALTDLALRADDNASPSFPITFRDDSAGVGVTTPGTKAEIFLDPAFGSFDGVRIASNLDVVNGGNTFNWPGGGVPAGYYWVRVKLTNAAGRVTQSYANGPLNYTG